VLCQDFGQIKSKQISLLNTLHLIDFGNNGIRVYDPHLFHVFLTWGPCTLWTPFLPAKIIYMIGLFAPKIVPEGAAPYKETFAA
ncbi:hypothetical protein, partial [Desulfitobacterium hafniense]|uniref:hypothetical protein n=1 Tax=Desulfitobacterium hafniense TaxID=49338 RepID=UPI0004776A8D